MNTERFAVEFPTECMALNNHRAHGTLGGSGFGFGGTNARVEMWGRHCGNEAPRKPVRLDRTSYSFAVNCSRCLGPMCYVCGEANMGASGPKHHCSTIRSEDAEDYRVCSSCFSGNFAYGTAALAEEDPGVRVALVGTWSGWKSFTAMEAFRDGLHQCTVHIGETRRESFRIVLNEDRRFSLYPMETTSDPRVYIVGPNRNSEDLHWTIDGHADGVPAGTPYRIRFRWGKKKREIEWSPVTSARTVPLRDSVLGYVPSRQHSYSISGSFSAWQARGMTTNALATHLWEARFRLGPLGREEFQILRDGDTSQAVHPPRSTAQEGPGLAIAGPDGEGAGKNWIVSGDCGEVVHVQFGLADGSPVLSVRSKSVGERTWFGATEAIYHVLGTWSGELQAMEPDRRTPGLYHSRLRVGHRSIARFMIAVNEDLGHVLYPELGDTPPGRSMTLGPNERSEGRSWMVVGFPGQCMDITLNLKAEDRHSMVSVKGR
eukprot:NODE_887_length_2715_cov_6.246522.p1 GENE.NODE_887_length_2715_cov_6.246522~~NODE_887_length_2715_cov_6.246522.p1  ORF type:complete len:488 (+),score=118.56 NODE_887_length_2715_cov_6.246522:1084-2547(+)